MKFLIFVAALLFARPAAAQTFEQTVNDALSPDGSIVRASREQKAQAALITADFVEAQFRGGPQRGGGDHRGGENRGGENRGGDRRGDRHDDRRDDHRGDRHDDHRDDHRGDRHDDHRDDHRGDRHDDHRDDHRGDGRRDHRDWGRWQGHPGWGHHDNRWSWNPVNHPMWWGWIVFPGGRGAGCYEHYARLERGCNDACQIESNECVSTCSRWGDAACAAQCIENSNFCRMDCSEQHSQYVARCW